MPNIERGGFGFSSNNLVGALRPAGGGGVLLPGSLAYDTYPTAAAPVTATTGGSSNTLGSDATVMAGSTITAPFYLVGCLVEAGALGGGWRWQFKASSVIGRTVFMRSQGTGITSQINYFNPFRAFPNDSLLVASASQNTATATLVYGIVLKKSPVYLPLLSGIPYNAVGTLVPNDITGIALTANGSTWVNGSYVTVLASTATPILITRVYMTNTGTGNACQVSLATGAAASEVDFAVLPFYTDSTRSQVHTLPFPILIDAGVRLSARNRSDTSSGAATVWVEYFPLPVIGVLM